MIPFLVLLLLIGTEPRQKPLPCQQRVDLASSWTVIACQDDSDALVFQVPPSHCWTVVSVRHGRVNAATALAQEKLTSEGKPRCPE